jgi:SAM-dependent methyltransferase
MDERPQTWHYGLVARWWAEFNTAQPEELEYYRAAIARFGEPALDLACGAGRLLVPLLSAGLDVEGADISPDMLARARQVAATQGLEPTLHVTAMHELDLPRRYRTIYCCDSFGLGGHREHDRLTMRSVFEHLEPGGAFVFNHYFPYDDMDSSAWARWLPGHRGTYPRDWPAEGERREATDGDVIELVTRAVEFDPILQRHTLGMRATLRRDGQLVEQEESILQENLYFAQELLFMLRAAGFDDVTVEGLYTGRPTTPDDSAVVFVARRPAVGALMLGQRRCHMGDKTPKRPPKPKKPKAPKHPAT